MINAFNATHPISPATEALIGKAMMENAKSIKQFRAQSATNPPTQRVIERRAAVLKMLKRGEKRHDIAQALETSVTVLDQDISWLAASGQLDPETRKSSCGG